MNRSDITVPFGFIYGVLLFTVTFGRWDSQSIGLRQQNYQWNQASFRLHFGPPSLKGVVQCSTNLGMVGIDGMDLKTLMINGFLQENPIFNGKNHGFLYFFPYINQSIDMIYLYLFIISNEPSVRQHLPKLGDTCGLELQLAPVCIYFEMAEPKPQFHSFTDLCTIYIYIIYI